MSSSKQYILKMIHWLNGEYEIYNTETNELTSPISIERIMKEMLFHEDIFTYDEKNDKVDVIQSKFRSWRRMTGILQLNNTYGSRTSKNQLYYIFVPYHQCYPKFLVPYNINKLYKHNNKLNIHANSITSLYCKVYFMDWTTPSTFPLAYLDQVFGPVSGVNALSNYELYQLSANNVHPSFLQFKLYKVPDCYSSSVFDFITSKWNVRQAITIDSVGTTIFDDAISWNESTQMLSIYITNLAWWIDTFNLFKFITPSEINDGIWYSNIRFSTIYLITKHIPMLPSWISDYASLQESSTNKYPAIALDCYFVQPNKNQNSWILSSTKFSLCLVEIVKNNFYSSITPSTEFIPFNVIQWISSLTLKRMECYPYYRTIENSSILFCSEFIQACMITYNYAIANIITNDNQAICRSSYNLFSNHFKEQQNWTVHHSNFYFLCPTLKIDHHPPYSMLYTHGTSPLRRYIDLVNQMILIKNLQFTKYVWKYTCELEKFLSISTSSNTIQQINDWNHRVRYVETHVKILNYVIQYGSGDVMNNNKIEKLELGIIIEQPYDDVNGKQNDVYRVYLYDLKIYIKVHIPQQLNIGTKIYCSPLYLEWSQNCNRSIQFIFVKIFDYY